MPQNDLEASMPRFLIGVATAAVWFVLSYAAHAERVCRQVCDNGICVSKCVGHPDSEVIIHQHDPTPRLTSAGPAMTMTTDDDSGR
jgi:hypothetical protein